MCFLGRVGMGRNKNHRDIARGLVGLELGTYLKAVHARHHDIEQHQIRRIVPAQAQRLGATGGHEDLVIAAEHLVHDLDVDGLIVHDQ